MRSFRHSMNLNLSFHKLPLQIWLPNRRGSECCKVSFKYFVNVLEKNLVDQLFFVRRAKPKRRQYFSMHISSFSFLARLPASHISHMCVCVLCVNAALFCVLHWRYTVCYLGIYPSAIHILKQQCNKPSTMCLHCSWMILNDIV